LGIVVLALAGCGGGDTAASPDAHSPDTAGSPNVIDLPAPAGTEAGQRVAVESGCLACHTIGEDGNDGPGGDLTHIGAKLDEAQMKRALIASDAPMPSFKALEPDRFEALARYLVALK
jgi:ubiquinol-cytochrome c reductase cytochrome b subunit/menaquinol-cytochrome c reductase cytochrome b/c subunit